LEVQNFVQIKILHPIVKLFFVEIKNQAWNKVMFLKQYVQIL